jgi:hypothetical protein
MQIWNRYDFPSLLILYTEYSSFAPQKITHDQVHDWLRVKTYASKTQKSYPQETNNYQIYFLNLDQSEKVSRYHPLAQQFDPARSV